MRLRAFTVAFAIEIVLVSSVCNAATHTAVSANFSDVQAAVAAAQDGDTVAIPAGNALWNQSIDVNKAITIQGAGSASTVIVNDIPGVGQKSSPLFILQDGGGRGPRRVTGIGMRSTPIVNTADEKQGIGVSAIGYATLKRIDHCEFDALFTGVRVESSNGVTDHNTYRDCGYVWRHVGHATSPTPGKSGQQYAWDQFRPVTFNSMNAFFHEDETIELSGQSHVCDTMEANTVVVRRCRIVLREPHVPYYVARCVPLFDIYGDDPDAKKYAPLATLIYDNRLLINNGASMTFVSLRGGSALIFNNSVVSYRGRGSAIVQLRDERNEHGERGVSTPWNPKLGTWPSWDDRQYEDSLQNIFIAAQYLQRRRARAFDTRIFERARDRSRQSVEPAPNAYTTLPEPLATPTYPHPLVQETSSQPIADEKK